MKVFKFNYEIELKEELKRLFTQGFHIEDWTHGFCDDVYYTYEDFYNAESYCIDCGHYRDDGDGTLYLFNKDVSERKFYIQKD